MDDLCDLVVKCQACKRPLTIVKAADTKEALHADLRTVITHDKSVPLLFYPNKLQVDIPDDAAHVCHEAHKFPELTPQTIASIKSSLQPGGALLKRKEEKMVQMGRGAYLRIGVGLESLGTVSAVLELWPVGHTSPKHQHGGCAGSIRVLHGVISTILYEDLYDEHPIQWKQGDANMELPAEVNYHIPVQAGQTTWLNRNFWFCHQVSAPATEPLNADGFALSLHVYKSCMDEFSFQSGNEVVKSNPTNDFFWNIDLPADDPRLQENTPDFGRLVLGAAPRGLP